jgi:hypothetical protein
MAVPRLNDRAIQRLFTDEEVTIDDLYDEVKMLRVAEALKADNVRVIYLILDAANGQLSQRAARAFHDAFRDNTKVIKLETYDDHDHLSILFEGVAASQSIRSLQVYNPSDSISVQDIAALANLDMLELSYCCEFERDAFKGLMA